jgi:hypothetical protein
MKFSLSWNPSTFLSDRSTAVQNTRKNPLGFSGRLNNTVQTKNKFHNFSFTLLFKTTSAQFLFQLIRAGKCTKICQFSFTLATQHRKSPHPNLMLGGY